MTGSLVVLSADNFQTFHFGTIAGRREPAKLENGLFEVKFECENSAMPEILPFVRYVMLESLVYFEVNTEHETFQFPQNEKFQMNVFR